MDQVVPWQELLALIQPHYAKAGRGRRPYPMTSMLRIHLMQNWFGLSDPGMEEALYEIVPMRQFAQLPLTGALPDETTVLNAGDPPTGPEAAGSGERAPDGERPA